MGFSVVILAAGKGTRMKSRTVKVLHPLAGRPMLAYGLDIASRLHPNRTLVVLGYQAAEVREAFSGYVPAPHWVIQAEQKGTADAVKSALPFLPNDTRAVLVLYGDVPLLKTRVLLDLLARHRERDAQLTLLTAELDDPAGYGRIVRDDAGRLLRIVEHADAGEEERKIREINTGILCLETGFLRETLGRVTPENAQGEYYLTDLVACAVSGGFRLEWEKTDEPFRALGINTRADLAQAQKFLREEICARWMLEGVSIEDPGTTQIDAGVTLGRDTRLEAGCQLRGKTEVGPECVLGAGSIVTDSRIGRGVRVLPCSVIEQSELEDHACVGPLAHLPPGTLVKRGSCHTHSPAKGTPAS